MSTLQVKSLSSLYKVAGRTGISGYKRRALAIHSLRGMPLTPREEEILQFASDDMATLAIAGRVHISPKTVSYHKANILLKMGKQSICACVAEGIRNGLIR